MFEGNPALTAFDAVESSQSGHILVVDDRPEVLRLIDRTLGDRFDCEFTASRRVASTLSASTLFFPRRTLTRA